MFHTIATVSVSEVIPIHGHSAHFAAVEIDCRRSLARGYSPCKRIVFEYDVHLICQTTPSCPVAATASERDTVVALSNPCECRVLDREMVNSIIGGG
jgi:hypothetical protein